MKNLSNTEAELKKAFLIKNACILRKLLHISNTAELNQTLTCQHLAIHLPEDPQKLLSWRVLDCTK